jgi:hypothetical protein
MSDQPAARPESNSTHLAGEYFVAAELYKRGFSVAITIGNAKAIDLFAERNRCTANVQVKAIRFKRHTGWPMTLSKVEDRIVYVFVILNEEDVPPSYFIGTGTEVRPFVKQYATRGVLNCRSLNSPQFRDRWDKIDGSLEKP